MRCIHTAMEISSQPAFSTNQQHCKGLTSSLVQGVIPQGIQPKNSSHTHAEMQADMKQHKGHTSCPAWEYQKLLSKYTNSLLTAGRCRSLPRGNTWFKYTVMSHLEAGQTQSSHMHLVPPPLVLAQTEEVVKATGKPSGGGLPRPPQSLPY